MSNILASAMDKINIKRRDISICAKRMLTGASTRLEAERLRLASQSSTLEALSPLKILAKGYALVSARDRIINTVSSLCVGDEIELRLNDGDLKCNVTEVYKRTDQEE